MTERSGLVPLLPALKRQADENDEMVWVDGEGPDWIHGGSYVLVRRIRLALEHLDRTELNFQEEVIGRRKTSGPCLPAGTSLHPSISMRPKDGNQKIGEHAHVRLGSASANKGARVLQRAYSYNDGFGSSRSDGRHASGSGYDAGLLVIAFQRGPRSGFIKIFEPMSKLNLLNQYATRVGRGIFVCDGRMDEGDYVGQKLFAGLNFG